MNPFQKIYDRCNTGTSRDKYESLPDFPKMIDLELTSTCNFRCKMCPTGNLSLGRSAGFMEEQTFIKIVMQCLFYGTALRFIGWGEPTLHPKLVKFIEIASRHGLLTHLNTNGSKIDEKMARNLVDAGLKSIKFSFQGVDQKSYEEMRSIDFFDGMIDAICEMNAARKGAFPYIAASTTTTYETDEQIEEFRLAVSGIVDHLTIGKTIFDYLDLNAVRLKPHEKEMLSRLKEMGQGDKNHPNPCPEVFDKLSIHYDGSVRVCCNDYGGVTNLGNVSKNTIQEMWKHPQIEQYRKKLADMDYSSPLCKDCYDYQGLTG